jgi:hypothetical protein
VLAGEQLENQALQTALLDIQSSVTDLQNAAHEAAHALQVVTDVQNVINIAVAAIAVGAAIMKPTPGTLANSIGTLVQAVKQAAAKPAGGTSK